MAKVALLIGVSEYKPPLNPLRSTVSDVEAMKQVLLHPDMGAFDDVTLLLNPEPHQMEEEIQALFAGRNRNDLVLLYFSGHGITDENSRLYFTTPATRRNPNTGGLIRATTVAASSVHNIMSSSRSKRQVVILDCCFSGAFSTGLLVSGVGSGKYVVMGNLSL